MTLLFRLCACLLLSLSFSVALYAPTGHAAQPVTTDTRIKTFVYNANEVFNVTTHYGYQSNIEFGAKETIDTVSVGDRVAWQIIPAGRRLFIRAMEENAHTNMTVVTNLRAYQFDLRSSTADAVFGSEELTYVMRFFYPDDVNNGAPMPVTYVRDMTPAAPMVSVIPAPSANPSPAPAASPNPAPRFAPAAPPAPRPAASSGGFNYRYTFSGPNDIAPVKIYDNGRTTYFKFPSGAVPQISVITARGETLLVPSYRTSDGLIATDAVAPRFSLMQAGREVIVYNETGGGA